MRKILVMEEDMLGNLIKECLLKAGYSVILVTNHTEALQVMNGEDRVDFVISACLHWKPSYEYALKEYGRRGLLFCSGSLDDLKDLRDRGLIVFEKPFPIQDLVDYITKTCPL